MSQKIRYNGIDQTVTSARDKMFGDLWTAASILDPPPLVEMQTQTVGEPDSW